MGTGEERAYLGMKQKSGGVCSHEERDTRGTQQRQKNPGGAPLRCSPLLFMGCSVDGGLELHKQEPVVGVPPAPTVSTKSPVKRQ